MKANIYCITNLVNGKRYVGITRFDINFRFSQHIYKSNNPKTRLHYAIKKYGANSFKIEKIGECENDWSATERDFIKNLKPEYNMTNGGEITLGKRVPQSVIDVIKHKNTGKKRTLEQNKANSERRKLQMQDPVLREKAITSLRIAHTRREEFEKKRLEGIKRAASEGKMSRVLTPERKARQLANLNTPEARAKMAASKCKKVICLDTGVIYCSLIEAAEKTGFSFSSISCVCLGKRKSLYGYRFKYI